MHLSWPEHYHTLPPFRELFTKGVPIFMYHKIAPRPRRVRLKGLYVTPETFVDFVDLVVPELQARGVYKTAYAPGTLREKLYGPGRARLPDSHPAARVRPAT